MFNQNKLLVVLLMCTFGAASSETIKLDQYRVYSINAPFPIEPSGLTMKGNQFFTVCDDVNVVFELGYLDENTMEATVYKDLDVKNLSAMALDFEGITVVENEFFVASETHHKLIRIDGDELNWVPQVGGLYDSAHKAGLFQLYNAGIEAVTYLRDQTFLMSVERQPRGLIEVEFDQSFSQIIKQSNQIFDDSTHTLVSDRKADLTGLYFYDGVIYAIHRNAYIIHELIKDQQGVYHEGQAWSYEHIVNHPDNAYQDMQFGHAEGLAVDGEHFYLVFDNNKSPKLKNPNDIRPLFIKAKRK